MSDVFIEHMVRRKSDSRLVAVKLLIAVAAFTAILALFALLMLVPSLLTFIPLLIAGVIWGAWILIRRRNLEFEYILTNGELDVDKIIARRTRKRVLSVDCRGFDILAPMTKEYLREYDSASIAKRVDASSSPESDRRWFAVFNGKDSARTLLIFEPSEKMLEVFRRLIPRKMPRV